ncbi:hypothetical protein VI817_002232 [Penicillium citrinum]|nr:hypothetical protein VI817_002232 [Penicillium citrinum]
MKVKELAALVKVNRRFYHLLSPVLYSVDARFGNSSSLAFAASKKLIHTARFAISRGADPNAREGDILWSAVENQDVEMARLLLEAGADPNGRPNSPWNLPHLLKILKPISSCMYSTWPNGALHIRSLFNESSRWGASRIKDLSPVLGVLLEFNPDVKCADDRGCTALHFAANSGCHELVRHLLDQGAYIEARDFNGHTPLCRAVLNNYFEVAKVLLTYQASTENQFGEEQDTPLNIAIRFADNMMSKLLLEHGADPQTPDGYGKCPLHRVAVTGNCEVALGLIEKGAKVNTLDRRQETPLQIAASSRHLHIIDILLRNDPDPLCRDVFNQITPYDYDKGEALHILATKGVDGTRLAAEAPYGWRGRKGS